MRAVSFAYRMEDYMGMAFHSHPYYEIYYFHSGRCNYVIGSNVYTLEPGDLIIMHGMTLHTPNPDIRIPYIRSIFHFHPHLLYEFFQRPYLEPLLRPFEELRNIRIQTGTRRAEIEEALVRMGMLYNDPQSSDEGRFLIQFVDFLYIIKELCMNTPTAPAAKHSGKERYVQSVIHFIEEHFREEITMEDLERKLHISRHYLARIFKSWTGWTVFQYLFRRRVNQAKLLLLLEDALTISQISESVGFKHHSHFSRVFKQLEGCTPEQYRSRERKGG